jgi:hypothetical protein
MHITKSIVNDFFAFFRGGLRKSCVFAHALQMSLVPIAGHTLLGSLPRFFNLQSKSGPAMQDHRQIFRPFCSLGVEQGVRKR